MQYWSVLKSSSKCMLLYNMRNLEGNIAKIGLDIIFYIQKAYLLVEQNVIDNEKILLKTRRSERVIKYSAEHVFTLRGTEEKKTSRKTTELRIFVSFKAML